MDAVRLSLVLPAYNEQAGLRQAIAEADDTLARLCEDHEILVVDDGSSDDTAAIAADEASRRPHVRVLRHPANRGYGAALRTGFEAARFDLVAFTDADCQFHLDDLVHLVPHTSEAPIVVGYRIDRQDPWRRKALSCGYNLVARTLLGTTVRDIDCALKVFRRETLHTILPESKGFFVNTEMLTRARQQGLKVVEVGVRHRPRLRGTSTVSLREVPRTLGRLLPFWWSSVLFAGGSRGEPTSRESPSLALRANGVCLVLVLAVASLLFFGRLRAPLLEPQEARYAEIPRQMLEAGRFLVPVLHNEDYLDKPPLLYWSVMAAYRFFGVHDWAARVIPALAGVFTVLIAFLWGRRNFGLQAGLCGALVLCLLPGFVYRGRMLTFDTPLALWITAALAAAHTALASREAEPGQSRLRWGWWLAAGLACGLGLLTKGPVALALVLPPLVAAGFLDRRLARAGMGAWVLLLGVAVLVAGPWYIAVCVLRPGFAVSFFWTHNVVRFVTPFDHARPMWFYLPGLVAGLQPWTLLLPGLLAVLLRRSRRMAARRPGALGMVLLSSLWMVVFFSAAGCKRPTYLLPALPPLALALGWYIHLRAPAWRELLVRGSRLATAAAALTLAAGSGVALTAALLHFGRPAAGFLLAATGGAALVLLVRWQRRLSWAASGVVVLAVLVIGVRQFLPAYNQQFALRGPLRRQVQLVERSHRPVVCYPMRYDSVSFYLPRSQVRVFGYAQKRDLIAHLETHPDTLVLIKSGRVFEDVVRDLPPGVRVLTRQRGGAVTVGRVVHLDEAAPRNLARR
jgi:dolichol-phosphate mannosyltransferase